VLSWLATGTHLVDRADSGAMLQRLKDQVESYRVER
jgi:hypothetical protein